MKKIGFIDLFIDEWHSNNYPEWFRTAPRAAEFELGYAWEEAPLEDRKPLDVWCKDMQMIPAKSIEEVVENSDCICVLAPSRPDVHERLAEIPLKSGKPVYIDKPFADSQAAAERLFALADRYNTPLMSSSALRFNDQLLSGQVKEVEPVFMATTGGGRSFDEYGIHQLEMIVSVMGTEVRNLKLAGDEQKVSLTLEYADGRLAQLLYATRFGFSITAAGEKKSVNIPAVTNFFPNLIAGMLDFFATGKSLIAPEETITIAGLLEKSINMLHNR
ncbi:MAG: oxidoreductase [Lentisphaerae bacterium]|nr:oxidoreductase [Lentisphaerota bacterium]